MVTSVHKDELLTSGPPTYDGDAKGSSPTSAKVALGTISTLGAAACGGSGANGSAPPIQSNGNKGSGEPKNDALSEAQAARFLLHATLSASAEQIQSVIEMGFSSWLENEMTRPNDGTARQFFSDRNFDTIDENSYFNEQRMADYMLWNQLMAGGNGLRKRISLALSEFFVVNLEDLNIRWRPLAIGTYWDMLNDNAFGNFRELLEDVTLSPVMASFLDVIGSQKSDKSTNREPDENFAREIMQLFTIGLVELNLDGTPKGQAGEVIETYTNDDVVGLAKCFTGYNLDFSNTSISTHPTAGWALEEPDFLYEPITADPQKWRRPQSSSLHSFEEKSFLDVIIPAGSGPETTLELALDTLFAHPNVGPFFGKQMIQRLTTSNPSPGYVSRVASAFNDNGNGIRGDLSAVFKAILLDDEARSEASVTDPRFGKLREPILRLAQWGRSFHASSISGNWTIDRLDRNYDQLGQSPFRSPTVFNFFRPSFVGGASNAQRNEMVAPEFALANETSVAGYLNFIQLMIDGQGYASRDVRASFSDQIELANDPQALVDHLDLVMTAQQMSPRTKLLILEAVESIALETSADQAGKLKRVRIAAFLTMASPDYLVQR
ncbi:DUF1800 family protein [Erythrobacter sp. F6033]|uniref:DUF1800 domain-containing protein n=1 Tax=Erythrobacter sp. F6033 TaxID=2926401 RepID=UPI001FF0E504|nr:DUF1800 family protein [Erythrobacter sp. F6033]MCK0127534.1 DUF1800 domain-containing protein [Erythrobacter sp. F6033]